MFGDRRLWPFVWRPFLLSAALFLFLLVGGFLVFVPFASRWAAAHHWSSVLGFSLGSAVYLVIWWFAATAVYLSLCGIVSSWFWGTLSEQIEIRALGAAPKAKINFHWLALDSVLRLSFSACVVLAATLSFWCLPLAVCFAGWLSLYDYTSPAFLSRRILFPRQTLQVFRCKGWPTFALTGGLLTLVPVVNILMLPALVAGGTLMCAEAGLKASVE